MLPVIESLPRNWEMIIYDNGHNEVRCHRADGEGELVEGVPDVSVYGRYAAIQYASHDLIYVADDDVIVSDPQAIVDMWDEMGALAEIEQSSNPGSFIVANMPQEFRHDGYTDSCLIGFGACFHRDLPGALFKRFCDAQYPDYGPAGGGYWRLDRAVRDVPHFARTCDVVFTTLAPARVLVDVEKTNREFASDDDRMWKQPGHVGERQRMLDLARRVRDAG